VAADTQALLPGQNPTYTNVTNYSPGINGIMIDVLGLPASARQTPADFGLSVGTLGDPAGGGAAPAPSSVTVRRGAGANGSDRVTLVWPDGAIKNTWLRVVVLPTLQTGLAAADVFYFGNLISDTGDSDTSFRVNALGLGRVKQQLNRASDITGRFDFNRDGRVNALDLGLVKANLNKALSPITAAEPLSASPFLSVGPAANLAAEASVRRVWDELETPVI
jgi:hypothetical protein